MCLPGIYYVFAPGSGAVQSLPNVQLRASVLNITEKYLIKVALPISTPANSLCRQRQHQHVWKCNLPIMSDRPMVAISPT